MFRQLALVLLIAQISHGFDLVAYKRQYLEEVAVPYKMAVTITATDIIEYLAKSPVPMSAEAGRQVAIILNTQTEIMSTSLSMADNSSNNLRLQLDREGEQLVAQASAVEQQLAANEKQLAANEKEIQQSNLQLADAQKQVDAAQQSVQNAQAALDRERQAEDKAKNHCTGLGGWLGHQVCGVFNRDGIRRAEDDTNRARNDLAGQQQRLAGFQTQQAQLQQKRAQLQQTRSNFEANKAHLTDQITHLNQARDQINDVDTKLKGIVAHVGTLLGKSEVLADVVKVLIDMETVIKPLTAIADQIIGYTGNASDANYLKSMKRKIATNLPMVRLKLYQYSLISPA